MLSSSGRGLETPRSLRSTYLLYIPILVLILVCSGVRADSEQSQNRELVQYPSDEVAFIVGPQLKAGSAQNPFPWFDGVELSKGRELGAQFPAVAPRTLTGTLSVRQGSTSRIR